MKIRRDGVGRPQVHTPRWGGEPEGSKGPVGPGMCLARGATRVVGRGLGEVAGDVQAPGPGARAEKRGVPLGVGPALGGRKIETEAVQPGRAVQRGTDPR